MKQKNPSEKQKSLSDKEQARIIKGVEKIFGDEIKSYNHFVTKLSVVNGRATLTVRQMYEFLPMNFSVMEGISKLIKTKDFNIDSWSSEGCETCNYGSSYEHSITWTVK